MVGACPVADTPGWRGHLRNSLRYSRADLLRRLVVMLMMQKVPLDQACVMWWMVAIELVLGGAHHSLGSGS